MPAIAVRTLRCSRRIEGELAGRSRATGAFWAAGSRSGICLRSRPSVRAEDCAACSPARPRRRRACISGAALGAGKSMLMDLFHDALAIRAKRRVHFHAFMQEIQRGMHEARARNVEDALEPVATAVAACGAVPVLRRNADHRHHRRDDRRAAVRDADRRWRGDRHHVEPPARRPVQGRAEPGLVPAVHRAAARENGGGRTGKPDRLPPAPA